MVGCIASKLFWIFIFFIFTRPLINVLTRYGASALQDSVDVQAQATVVVYPGGVMPVVVIHLSNHSSKLINARRLPLVSISPCCLGPQASQLTIYCQLRFINT